jgi:tetratricopeptide (TPR) repeat protein
MGNRSVKARNISNSAIVTGSGNVVTLTFGASGVSLPLLRKQIRRPRRQPACPADEPRELDILNPELSPLELVGRRPELEKLTAWLDDGAGISVHAITGRAGSGKTRLAMELCAQVDGAHEIGAWAAGFLSATELPTVVEVLATHDFAWERPTLLVIDYAGQVHTALARWLDRLAYQKLDTKLRLLLLEREAPDGFGWWRELTGSALNQAAARRGLFHNSAVRPFDLPGLEALEERRRIMTAAHAAAQKLRSGNIAEPVPPAGADPSFDPRLAESRFGNPLALVMAGVLALDQGPQAALALHRLDAARKLARRELDRLKALAGPGQGPAMTHLAAFNGLAGGLSLAGLNQSLSAELAAAGLSGDAGALALVLQHELPPSADPDAAGEARLGTVQPDLIGEGLIIEALTGPPAVEAGAAALLERAYAIDPTRSAAALMRLLQDHAYALEDSTETDSERRTAQRLMAWLNHLAAGIASPRALEPLALALPEQTTILREPALELTRRLAEAFMEAFRLSQSVEDGERAAGWHNNLALRLSDLGRREPAFAAAEEAAGLYRDLAAARPDAFAPDLAMSLSTLASCLSALGQPEPALAAAEEAVGLRRALAAARPDAFTPDLARALYNLANCLSDLGRREPALAAAEEAVRLRRALAAAHPDAFTPDLATSLDNLASHLSGLGQRESALGAAEEALVLFRALAAARPDAFTPALTGSLTNFASHLSALGQRELALATAEEAVGLYRALADERPDAFTPDLATSLNNLANRRSDLGQREPALAAAEEAVRLRRDLAAARPDAFTPELAGSLNNLANRLSDLGRPESALAAAEEAVGLHRSLATARPDAFTPGLAMSLNNIANRLSALGRHEPALAAAEEAVALCRALAAERADAFTPSLAMSLNNLANCLYNLGQREPALAAAEETVRLYRTLADERPGAFTPDLAMSLNNLAPHLSDLGQHEPALVAAEEAVELYRALAAAHPDAFGIDLSVSLNALSAARRIQPDDMGACDALAEAIAVLMPFFQVVPQAVGHWMAMHLQRYLELCEELGLDPDMHLIGPALAVFQRLDERGGDDGEEGQ